MGPGNLRRRRDLTVDRGTGEQQRGSRKNGKAKGRPTDAPPMARAESKAANEAAADMASSGALRAPAPAPSLGTGHGRREESLVSQVAFERERDRPNEVIRIRYDSRENLVAMGVIRESAPRPRK